MKIIATVRTRNEEANIGRFCEAYQNIADLILVADGGSEDRTIEIADTYPKVEVLPFYEMSSAASGHWVNPQGRHTNFLIDEATRRGADWITFDDCDCVPNYLLRSDARSLMLSALAEGNPAIYTRRVYFFGNKIFADLHKPNTSIWAFTPDSEVRANETDPLHLIMYTKNLRPESLHLEFPYCLLHLSWPSEEAAQKKIKWYRESGVQPGALHPKSFAGPLSEPESFMAERPE